MNHARIAEWKFSILGSDDVKLYAQGKVTSEELFLGQSPVPGGLYSLELQPKYSSCASCELKMGECIGHADLLELNYPIESPLFIRQIGQWLKSVCIKCGMPLLNLKDYSLHLCSEKIKRSSGDLIE